MEEEGVRNNGHGANQQGLDEVRHFMILLLHYSLVLTTVAVVLVVLLVVLQQLLVLLQQLMLLLIQAALPDKITQASNVYGEEYKPCS